MIVQSVPAEDFTTPAIGFEQITVTSSGVATFSAAKYKFVDGFKHARAAYVTAEIVDFDTRWRYTVDGTTPTDTVGHQLTDTAGVLIRGCENIAKFKAIAEDGSVVLDVTYFV